MAVLSLAWKRKRRVFEDGENNFQATTEEGEKKVIKS